MKVLLLVAILSIVTVVSAITQCYDDSECPDGCCAHSSRGNVCKLMGRAGDVCDLEGQHLADGVCNCEPGLTCEKIDLSPISPIAASANPILEKYHFGVCGGDLIIG